MLLFLLYVAIVDLAGELVLTLLAKNININ